MTQISFKPNWTKHVKAAPFRRNDEVLSVIPGGLIVFPGNGITAISPTRRAAWYPGLAGQAAPRPRCPERLCLARRTERRSVEGRQSDG